MERPNHIIVFSMSMWLGLCVQLFCLHFAKSILTAVHVTGAMALYTRSLCTLCQQITTIRDLLNTEVYETVRSKHLDLKLC